MKSWSLIFLASVLILSCQLIPTPPPLDSTSVAWTTPRAVTPPVVTPSEAVPTADVTRENTLTPSPGKPSLATASLPATYSPGELPPFPYHPGQPFANIEKVSWKAGRLADTANVPLPVSLEQVENRAVIAGLTSRQQAFLANNGFVVLHSQEAQFSGIRERVSLRYGQPYYLTTDAALHALHLTLDELFSALEREELLRRMTAITQATLSQVNSYLPFVQGTSLEADTLLTAAYLAVALRLFDPQTDLEPHLDILVTDQVGQILAGRGVEDSTLIPNFKDDFKAYRPVGHYAGDSHLEGYFRGMAWFERVHFDLQNKHPVSTPPIRGQESVDSPSRVPLVLTLALRQAHTAGWSAAQEWSKVQEVLDFLIGPSRDLGPAEYAELMDQIYGRGITVVDLSDDAHWQAFQSLAPVFPSPQISPVFLKSLADLDVGQNWRFMGRRFNLDDLILQNLVYDRVGTTERMRETPSGLDVMAAFGSSTALQLLEGAGDTAYANYLEQMEKLQNAVQTQSEMQWQATAFNSWMHAFIPKLITKDEEFPSFMRSSAWSYKDLNSSLGGWVDVKHDTVIHATTPEITYDGRTSVSGPAPGYVEADPLVFYRLAHLAMATAEGLDQRGFVGVFSTSPLQLGNLLLDVLDLGDRFQRLGDIAAKELAGVPLDESDHNLIQAPLGPAEERAWLRQASNTRGMDSLLDLPTMEVVASVGSSGGRILQVGLGAVDRIYVILPLKGKLQIAQGGVFSYYEFLQPRSWQLSDEEWRQLMRLSPPDRPGWVKSFSLPDGNPVDVLAFRVGDVFRITPAGAMISLYESPSRNARVVCKLQSGDYLMIVDGPTLAEKMTWWKSKTDTTTGQPVEGWTVANQEWYERVWKH